MRKNVFKCIWPNLMCQLIHDKYFFRKNLFNFYHGSKIKKELISNTNSLFILYFFYQPPILPPPEDFGLGGLGFGVDRGFGVGLGRTTLGFGLGVDGRGFCTAGLGRD